MYTLVEFLRRITMDNIAKYLTKLGYQDMGESSLDGLPKSAGPLRTFKSGAGSVPVMLPVVTPENSANIAAWMLFMLSTVIGKTPDQVLAEFIDATTIVVAVVVAEPTPPADSEPPISATDPFSTP